jgi:hypothetical protein
MKYSHKITIIILLLLTTLFTILFIYPKSYSETEDDKKVKINTDRNEEVQIPIQNKTEKLDNLGDLHALTYVNYKDCASDLSCVIKADQDIFQKTYKELENHADQIQLNTSNTSSNTSSKGYMTDKELEGYAPDGLKYCADLTMDKFNDLPLFYNAPLDTSNNSICRNCKVGYCLGDVCGSEIHKNPSDMPNYFY